MNADLQKLRKIFEEAAGRDTPEARAAYLDEACRGDAELRAAVERLFEAETRAGDFLEAPVMTPVGTPVLEGPGALIGHYKLLEEIGEGAFGRVFMAEQTAPVRRKVALKIIKAGMDTREVIARFEAERQALALMEHPNIARILDAGATESGRPFFVMELVRGLPITEYCDRNDLRMAERLQLFLKVCQAVQHAHQKGIIHRDLKPTNILVTMIDGEPVPKIIDFGIAKALGQQLTEKTLFTAFAQVIGTPAYMSPEQTEFSGVDVDTRSDIYSLGVLLYELLTGVTPLDAETLRKAGIEEIRRLIRETDPPKPSTRLRTLGDKLADVAQHRHAEPSALARQVHGDLDWIVMKALEKDRSRRYEAAGAFAQDIQRHLGHKPVAAGPPSAVYRTRKFVRRHRTGMALAAAVTTALVVGLVASLIGFAQARSERDRALAAELEAQNERERAETFAAESQRRLVRRYLTEGNRLVEQGDLFSALLPFATALSEDKDNAPRADLHRLRLATTLQQCPKLVVACFHGNNVNYAEFSPDDSRILTASRDRTARVWDAATGSAVTPPLQHSEDVQFARFSPDGKWVVTASRDGTAQVWNASTGERRGPPLRHPGPVRSANFSPDSRWILTASDDETARVWDAATGDMVGAPLGHRGMTRWAEFSSDGSRILVTSHDWTRVWTFTPERSLALSFDLEGGSAQLSPDGRRLVMLRANMVGIWDVVAGRQITSRRIAGDRPGASFSSDGAYVATAGTVREDSVVQVWDANTGDPVAPQLTHPGVHPIRALAFSPDGRRVLSAAGFTVRVWDLDAGRLTVPPLTHGGPVRSAAFSRDGRRVLTSSDDGSARVWDLAGGELARPPVTHPRLVHKIIFHPDARRVMTISVDGTAQFWDLDTSAPSGFPASNLMQVAHADFSPDGRMLALANTDGTARVWDVATGEPVAPRLNGQIHHIEFSSDGRRVVTAGRDGSVCIWRVVSGRLLAQMSHTGAVSFASFSPDGRRVVSATVNSPGELLQGYRWGFVWPTEDHIASDAEVKCWDATSGRLLGSPQRFSNAVTDIVLSPDRLHAITVCSKHDAPGRSQYTQVWDLTGSTSISPRLSHEATLVHGEFSTDGKRVVTNGRDGTTRVWDAATGNMLTVPIVGGFSSCTLSPDGALVATAGDTLPEVRLWDAATGQLVGPPLRVRPSGVVNRVCFSPDGGYLVTATSDNHAQALKIRANPRPLEDDLLLAQMLAGRSIDDLDAKQQFVRGRLQTAFQELYARYPKEFIVTREQKLAWLNRMRAERANHIEALRENGKLSELESLFGGDLAERRKLLGDEHPELVGAMTELAEVLRDEGELAEAEAVYRKALAMGRTTFGEDHRNVCESLGALARVLVDQDRFEEAVAVWREELALERRLSGEEHAFVANSLMSLGSALEGQDSPVEAEEVYREALAMRRRLLGDECGEVALSLHGLRRVLSGQGKLPEAEAAAREALAIWRTQSSADHRSIAVLAGVLARVLREQGKDARGEEILCDVLIQFQQPATGDGLEVIAEVGAFCAEMGDTAAALSHFSRELELAPASEAALYRCALLHLIAGKMDRYRSIAARIVSQLEEQEPGPNAHLLHWACALAPDAVTDYSPILQAAGRSIAGQTNDAASVSDVQTLGALLYRADRYPEAAERLTQAYQLSQRGEASVGSTSPAYGAYFLAMTHARLGHAENANEWFRRASEVDPLVNPGETDAPADIHWNRRLTLQLLRKEAEAALSTLAPRTTSSG